MGWIDEPSVLPGKSEQVESLHCLYEVLFWKIFFFFCIWQGYFIVVVHIYQLLTFPDNLSSSKIPHLL